MARRLVEAGVPFVEVDLGGWDNHSNIFPTLQNDKLPVLDQAMSALVEDLEQRGRLQDTVMIWMGEFGRTPRINGNAGRDHWARAWSVVLGGGGLKGGIAVGETNADGTGRDGTVHLAGHDGHRLPGAGDLAGNDVHQPERPPDEDRQWRQTHSRVVLLNRERK